MSEAPCTLDASWRCPRWRATVQATYMNVNAAYETVKATYKTVKAI